MAETEWTVFWGQRDAGNQKPITGWTTGELKVAKIGAGTELKKNKPAPNRETAASVASCTVQQAYFATVIAESAEEACLVVDKMLALGADLSKEQLESVGGGGPSIKPFVNSSGKAFAAKTSNIEEVAVL
ncbi:MAG TPA: hypothetical protein VMT20_06950 [Terriglobia bacterium]|nr:hypothetical protein [Terriglobia bacterium]